MQPLCMWVTFEVHSGVHYTVLFRDFPPNKPALTAAAADLGVSQPLDEL